MVAQLAADLLELDIKPRLPLQRVGGLHAGHAAPVGHLSPLR